MEVKEAEESLSSAAVLCLCFNGADWRGGTIWDNCRVVGGYSARS